jgi:uncharacterized protein with PQ loop repeat
MGAAAQRGPRRFLFARYRKGGNVSQLPADGACVKSPGQAPVTALEKVLRGLSVFTMLMTVPQVYTIWVGHDAGGVSGVSWAAYLLAACLWFVYGLQKGDKTIYLACVGWVLLDAAVVAGVMIYG